MRFNSSAALRCASATRQTTLPGTPRNEGSIDACCPSIIVDADRRRRERRVRSEATFSRARVASAVRLTAVGRVSRIHAGVGVGEPMTRPGVADQLSR